MKRLKLPTVAFLVLSVASTAFVGCKTDDSERSSSSLHMNSATTAAAKPYPLNKCLVTGEALEAGKSYTFVRDGQEIKLCCKDCLADFEKNPSKYLAKIK
jgi:hypothetical protein